MTDSLTSNSSNPPHDDPQRSLSRVVTAERAAALLASGTLTSVHSAALWWSNYSALLYVREGDLQAIAVYKPQRGERPLWDFPDGTLCCREVAAYHVSQTLGWQLVPPTALREGPHGIGSLQLFIDHDPELNYFELDDRFVTQLQHFAVFDFLVNNADRKGGHLLLDARGKLWGIDHGLTFHIMPKLRTVIWEFAGQPVVEPIIESVQRLSAALGAADSDLRQKLTPLLSPAEIEALQQRTQQFLATRVFPAPGPGQNHPWPPI
ncbi:MAG: SCO1664 family protein [Anaerolineae bacterium]|nr:SCO1664 family protein [Anaerolineae bacterium]